MIDTLRYTRNLEAADLTSEQAELIVRNQIAMITDNVATKLDFNDLKHEFAGLRSDFMVLNKKFDREIGSLNDKIDREIGSLNDKIDREIGSLNDKIDREIGGVYKKIDDTKSELILRIEKSAQTTTIRLGIMMVSALTFFSSLIVFLNKLNI